MSDYRKSLSALRQIYDDLTASSAGVEDVETMQEFDEAVARRLLGIIENLEANEQPNNKQPNQKTKYHIYSRLLSPTSCPRQGAVGRLHQPTDGNPLFIPLDRSQWPPGCGEEFKGYQITDAEIYIPTRSVSPPEFSDSTFRESIILSAIAGSAGDGYSLTDVAADNIAINAIAIADALLAKLQEGESVK